jgi:hypothetical protein
VTQPITCEAALDTVLYIYVNCYVTSENVAIRLDFQNASGIHTSVRNSDICTHDFYSVISLRKVYLLSRVGGLRVTNNGF